MQGFDSKFKDFPDYIIGITREIWENRGIATYTTTIRTTSWCARRDQWWLAMLT